ncbi:ProQ/FINO family protein [Curvibacter sp. APW13]|uniref:ProQ/FINO family protein n=1 Tax=Curvibacter sp. APW13 TaxID=3077236 RepID=UPI0028DE132F|nr:ProQ/FINO family protein [Curvibacter sp. APW13]MDT8992028.1 ProQ/FINO family protein [Curvibacter sp. APW13]
MSTEVATAPESATAPAAPAKKSRNARQAQAMPVLEKLFALYPGLFGAEFLPLKRGIFQDLMQAHPDAFDKAALKEALSVHTRSTRYLQAMASAKPRHDLQMQAVEPVAPEHVYSAVVELYRRRQMRKQPDALSRLQRELSHAVQASGLGRTDYLALAGTPEPEVAAALEEVLGQVERVRAKDAALLQAFDAAGKSVMEFAFAYGVPATQVRSMLKRNGRNDA